MPTCPRMGPPKGCLREARTPWRPNPASESGEDRRRGGGILEHNCLLRLFPCHARKLGRSASRVCAGVRKCPDQVPAMTMVNGSVAEDLGSGNLGSVGLWIV